MAKRGESRKSSESVDDYLKAIYHLSGEEQRRVGSSELAVRLDVAPASITNMLQKLAAERRPFIDYERGKGVRLSAVGKKRALEIVRHHRLIETFLFEVLGYPIGELHEEAERLEHFISERFEERVAARLGNPEVDPHGHCIPSLDGVMPKGHGETCGCGRPEAQ
ncbi:MAG: metal-dependent transcriptional regulator [Acidobacteriota bacterium]